jgi:hypothetical protein
VTTDTLVGREVQHFLHTVSSRNFKFELFEAAANSVVSWCSYSRWINSELIMNLKKIWFYTEHYTGMYITFTTNWTTLTSGE